MGAGMVTANAGAHAEPLYKNNILEFKSVLRYRTDTSALTNQRNVNRTYLYSSSRCYYYIPGIIKIKKYSSCEIEDFKGVFGTVRTEAYRRYILPVLPIPDTSVSSVRYQYRYRQLR